MRLTRLLPATLLALAAAMPAAAADDNDQAAICAEAEDRYVELFGHPSADEDGVTVVLMYQYNFCPGHLTVKPGITVRWVNVDKRTSHSVLVKNSEWPESDRLFPEESVEFTFLSAGDHDYLCGPHWDTHDMIGMVSVAE